MQPGGFFPGKQFQQPGWVFYRTDLTPERYQALRRAFAEFDGFDFDTSALKWYPLFPGGCCAGTHRHTMCSHVVADVYSRRDVGILRPRELFKPFTQHTPATIRHALEASSETRLNQPPRPVVDRCVQQLTPQNLLTAAVRTRR